MEDWGRRGGGQFLHPHPPLLQSAMERVGWVGQGVTLLALVPERGHSPEPQAHSGAEDSEVKLVMPQGLVTKRGPGPLPAPATLLHPLGKSNLTGPAQEPVCCPGGEWREGELGGHHHHQYINGNSPWHGMGHRPANLGGLAPHEGHQIMHQGCNTNTHP